MEKLFRKKTKGGGEPMDRGGATVHLQPSWVTEMHQHYQKTGYFRSEDLDRVLGDPREGVEVHSTDTRHAASHGNK